MLRKTTFLLLVAVILVMVAATLIEKQMGSAAMIFGSWWFASLWAILAVCGLCYAFRRKLYKKPATMLLHLAFVVILAGALITHLFGQQGTVHLRVGHPTAEYITSDNLVHHFPFFLKLEKFEVEYYPGTQSPMDYASKVLCSPENVKVLDQWLDEPMSISMNNIGEHLHYRFYQSGYDPDMQGTFLSVSHDPWGIGVTYVGYGLLFLSMFLLMILPNEGFRKAMKTAKAEMANRQIAAKAEISNKQISNVIAIAVLIGVSLFAPATASAAPKTLPKEQAHEFCDLRVYYNGRICPIQTVAKDFTMKLYGKMSYEGMNFEQVFCGFVFYPTTWLDVPIIKVKGDAIEALGIEGKYASYNDFFKNGQYKLEEYLYESNRAIQEADEKANILKMLWAGELLKLYPYQGQWYSQGDNLPMDIPQDEYFFIKKSLDYVGELVVTGQEGKLSETIDKINKYQEKQFSADLLPSDAAFRAEKLYNTSDYTKPMAMAFATLGIVLFLVFVFMGKNSAKEQSVLPKWITATSNVILVLAVVYLFFLMALRSYVSGHLPLSNGYETMQFMAFCVLVLTVFMQRRYALILPFGFLLSGLALLVSMMGEANPQITLLMPVLQSPLLSLHVCIIMIAYSLLAFCFLNGIAYFILRNRSVEQSNNRTIDISDSNSLTNVSRLMLYPALFCMAAGIFIGAIWANVSWGRYWGWDPKEVWALITLLVYSFALHSQSLPMFRKPAVFHGFMIGAFLTVLMTYFGVNYFLSGMHSYA